MSEQYTMSLEEARQINARVNALATDLWYSGYSMKEAAEIAENQFGGKERVDLANRMVWDASWLVKACEYLFLAALAAAIFWFLGRMS